MHTVTDCVKTALELHEFTSVPITVNVVVRVGVMLIELLRAPVFQLYVSAPPANKLQEEPRQSKVLEVLILTVGKG